MGFPRDVGEWLTASPQCAAMEGLVSTYRHIFHDLADRRSDDMLLVGSPLVPIGIVVLYVYFVRVWGPRFMKNRAPYNVDRLIAAYNLVQVAYNLNIFTKAYTMRWGYRYRLFCEPVDYSDDPYALFILGGIWQYYVIKIVDLLDTVFFILRKKDSQVTFLHVYHHSMMVMATWIITRYVPGGHISMVGYLNTLVHMVMYSYYFITSMWPQYKNNLWWKKHITQLQMAQFVFLFLHSLPTQFMSDCPYPVFATRIVLANSFIMMILFYNFYRRTYGKKKAL